MPSHDNSEDRSDRSFLESKKKKSGFLKSQTTSTFRYLTMKYSSTRFGQNVDNLLRYKRVYYHLTENELPILKGGQRKKRARQTQ